MKASLLSLGSRQFIQGSLFPLTALFAVAATLLLFRGSGFERNFGDLALLKCGLQPGDAAGGGCSPLLDRWPASGDPLLRGVLAYQFGDALLAASFFKGAQAAHPSDPVTLFWLASAAYRSGDTPGALLAWQALGPRKMALFFRDRSKAAQERGELSSALEQALISVAVDPACGEALLQLGQVYFQQGDLVETGRAFRKALSLDLSAKDRGAAYHTLAEIDRSLGDDEQALDEYRLAVEFTPLYSAPLYPAADAYLYHRDLADQYARLHRDQEARALLLDLLAVNPNDASVLVRVGNLSLNHERYAEAERWYQAAVSADPGSGAGEAALGRLYRQKGDFDQAAVFFRRSAELNPGNLWVLASLGGIYWQQGQIHQAIAAYEWVTLHSMDRLLLEDAWSSLARLYSLTGSDTQARSAWESVLKINPANSDAQKDLRDTP